MAVVAVDRGRPAERRMLTGRRNRKANLSRTFNHTGPDANNISFSASITQIQKSKQKPESER